VNQILGQWWLHSHAAVWSQHTWPNTACITAQESTQPYGRRGI